MDRIEIAVKAEINSYTVITAQLPVDDAQNQNLRSSIGWGVVTMPLPDGRTTQCMLLEIVDGEGKGAVACIPADEMGMFLTMITDGSAALAATVGLELPSMGDE